MGKGKEQAIIDALTDAYWMEMEAVMNFIAVSSDLDGVRAEQIKTALAGDIPVELGHAQTLARRIRELGGRVPGSLGFQARQTWLQPPADSTDVAAAIQGVIETEEEAIRQYNKIIRLCEGSDYVTQELCIGVLGGEETHRREFVGFKREYEKHK